MDQQQQFDAIMDVVRSIPPGHVMTYGQVGAVAGGISARVAGWAMANVGEENIPWQRVVAAGGRLSIGSRDEALAKLQRSLLEQEGIAFLENGCVDMREHQAHSFDVVSEDELQSEMSLDL